MAKKKGTHYWVVIEKSGELFSMENQRGWRIYFWKTRKIAREERDKLEIEMEWARVLYVKGIGVGEELPVLERNDRCQKYC